jgi:SET family sugar efflux transporter-like MFS transporter
MLRLVSQGRTILRHPGLAGLLASTLALGMAFSFVSTWGTQEIGMRPVWFGTFMTVTALSAIVASTTLARWSDTHVPRKIMLAVGGASGALGYAGYAFLRDPFALLAVGATAIAFASICFSQLFAHVREEFSGGVSAGAAPGFLTGLVRVCFSVAWTAGPALGAALLERHGFRGLFLGAASLYLLFLGGVLAFVPWRPRLPLAQQGVHQPVWRVLTRGDILAVFVAFLLVFASHAMNLMNLPLTITTVLGGTQRDLGIAFGIGPVVEIPLMLWFGHLAARGRQLGLIRMGAAVTVAYFFALSLARAPWHVYPIQILSGVSFAILTNVAILFFQDLLPGRAGLATAIFSNASNLGNLVGYFSFGALVGAVGHHGVSVVCAGLTVVTLVLLLAYRPRPQAAAASRAG